jgi:transposase
MGTPFSLYHERVDDVPLLLGLMQRLGLPEVADHHLGQHGHHQGLSSGSLLMVWLAYLISHGDHRKAAVREWAQRYPVLLARLLGVALRPTEFTDDRLALLLGRLSKEEAWHALEAELWQHTLAVAVLPVGAIRLDATTTYGYHTITPGGLMQLGRSKDHRPDLPQLLVMAAAAEPAGHLLGADVHPGQRADDVCYLPLIQRVHRMLGETGLLYIGDCKMAALSIRAAVVAQGDYYLMPLPRSGTAGQEIDAWIEEWLASAEPWQLIWDAGEILGAGREFTREIRVEAAGAHPQWVTWTERVQVFRSLYLLRQQSDHLEGQLTRAATALEALTPPGRPGKRLYREEAPLREAVTQILAHYGVEGLLRVSWEEVQPSGATKLVPRWVIAQVEREEATIEARRWRLGWRVQVTCAPSWRLSFPAAVLQYREGWCLERGFHLFKERPLGIRPLFVRRDDQICGLTHLVTLGLRLLTLLEVQVRADVRKTGELWTGLYVGQPQRATAQPTAPQLLGAIARAEITLTRVEWGGEERWHLTALPPLLERTLACMGLSAGVYQRLMENST